SDRLRQLADRPARILSRTQRRGVRTVPRPAPYAFAGLRTRPATGIPGTTSPQEGRNQDQNRDHGEGADPDPPPALAEDDLALARLGRGALDPLRPLALLGARGSWIAHGPPLAGASRPWTWAGGAVASTAVKGSRMR